MELKYKIEKEERYAVMTIHAENLNSLVAPDLKSKFVKLSTEGEIANLVLNLEEVKYVDSSGLSAILTANRLWKALGSFVLTGIRSESVKKLIKISHLDSVLTILPTVEESKEYIFMEELEREINADTDPTELDGE